MKRSPLLAALAAATGLALAFTGCSTGAEPSSSEAAPVESSAPATTETPASEAPATAVDCKIGMTQINQTAVFFTQMNEGAQEAATAAGCELTIANANNDSAKQNSDIETLAAQGITGLIVVAIDVNGVLPAVKAARDKGIKVVAIDAELEEGSVDTFVGVDNANAGKQMGEWMVEQGMVEGKSYGVVDAKNSFIQNQREDSFREVIDAAGAKYTQSVNGENVQEKAATAAQNLATAQPDLDFIYATGEPATVGAVAVIPADSKTKVIGWDLTKEVIAGIDAGIAQAIVQQNPKQEGVEAVNELVSLLGGGSAKGFIDVPITVVTKDNVDEFRAIFP
jgi:ribose transport system substrate-binding protein